MALGFRFTDADILTQNHVDEDDVPVQLARQFETTDTITSKRKRCAQCYGVFSGSAIGMLSCLFHPMDYYNTNIRTAPYTPGVVPTNCYHCNFVHMDTNAVARSDAYIPGDKHTSVRGCTRVDCTTDIRALIDHPYACVPQMMASRFFTLRNSADANHVLLINEPSQMSLVLSIFMPGTRRQLLVPVIELYKELRALYDLNDLDSEIRMARRGPSASSITRLRLTSNGNRLDVYRMHAPKSVTNVSFVPFYVVARVSQPHKLALVDIPEMVDVLADDDLI